MNKISFVTGGTGFIGGFLVKRLIDEGHTVRILSRNIEKAKKTFGDTVEIIGGDLFDNDALKRGLDGADFVFHMAAKVGDYGPKEEFYRVNVDGTKSLLDACNDVGTDNLGRFIYLSSNAVIGMKRKTVTDETAPYSNSGGHYGISKGMAEKLVLKRCSESDFPGVVIRPSVVYGPGSPNWVMRPLGLMKAGKMVYVDGGRGRCWHVYVENVIDAVMLATTCGDAPGEIFTISDNDGSTTWKEYFTKLAICAGYSTDAKNLPKFVAMSVGRGMYWLNRAFGIKPVLTPMGVGILTSSTGVSIEKAKSVLGFSPKVDLDEGMRRVGAWYKDEGMG